jgi:adenosylmethionine-8-amino-7-oxononanoate aminotransferase
MDRAAELAARDLACVWHPYAPPRLGLAPLPVARAEGVRLFLEDGRVLIDGMSSWWAAIHGYGHPALVAAIAQQARTLSHVMFGGLTHEPAIALCERLVTMLPGMARVFLCDAGSVSVEVALKLALQFWQATGRPEKRRIATARGGYHGDTLGAMSVCDPVNGMHGLFQGLLPAQLFAERPGPAFDASWDEGSAESLAALFEAHAGELAALILEPIVQGAGGMRFYHPEYLRRARALCDAHGVLLILDEIATGFGRSGVLFGAAHAGVTADIVCVGKALTGGMLTLAACLCSERVADGIAAGAPGALMHGPTFMANPLACAAALASLELLLASPWQARVQALEAQLKRELAPLRGQPSVADVRVLGAIGVVELKEPIDMARAQEACSAEGVWLRPFGKLLYTMPPYITEADDVSRITRAMARVVSP